MKSLLLIVALVAITACDKASTDGTYARAKAESEAGKDTQNSNLEDRSKRMENDLRKKYRFFKSISNDYAGTFRIRENSYQLKLGLASTLHVIETDRVRSLEEIQDDLNNLFLNVQIVTWDNEGNMGAGSCVFEQVRPDVMSGMVQLVSSDCPNRYTIYLTTPNASSKSRLEVSSMLARSVLAGNQTQIKHLYVEVNSKFNPKGYGAVVTKR